MGVILADLEFSIKGGSHSGANVAIRSGPFESRHERCGCVSATNPSKLSFRVESEFIQISPGNSSIEIYDNDNNEEQQNC